MKLFEKFELTQEQKERLTDIIDNEEPDKENIILCEGYSRQQIYTDPGYHGW